MVRFDAVKILSNRGVCIRGSILLLQRIHASPEQIAVFFAALELIQVWNWRNDYHPRELAVEVLDGSRWTFAASFGNRTCRCGGTNAYPSFADPLQATLNRGQYALLHAAMYDSFGINAYIQQAERLAAGETGALGPDEGR